MTAQPKSSENRAFVPTPDPGRYFPASAVEDARKRIVRAVNRGEGPAVICGVAGLGKSQLLSVLEEQYNDHMYTIPVAAAQVCSRRELLQTILFRLDRSYRGLEDIEMRLSILEHLTGDKNSAAQLLLLIDDADMLPPDVFDELRGLLSVVQSGSPLVHVVLAGSAALEERLAEPALDALSQRISVRSYLSPLSRDETYQYVRSQIAAVDVDPSELLSSAALEAVFSATDGVPRLINQLCDQLMCAAEDVGSLPLDGDAVQQVWSEIQQLPSPADIARPAVRAPVRDEPIDDAEDAGVIEFGLLDDEDEPIASVAVDDDQPAALGLEDLTSVQFAFEDRDETERKVRPGAAPPDESAPASIPFAAATSRQPERSEAPVKAEAGRGFSFADPFADSFAEEESLVDRYAIFESELLQSAPHVVNRIDGAFAGELLLAIAAPLASRSAQNSAPLTAVEDKQAPSATPAVATERELPEPCVSMPATRAAEQIEVLVIEDDGRGAHEVVPSRQFRRLFSELESANAG